MVASGGNVGVAWAMVIGAGAASSLGAAVVFCVNLASKRMLACSLGFAAGVMLYVVFTEIFMVNSKGEFELAGYSSTAAYRLSTACLFGGILATGLLDCAVHALMHWGAARRKRRLAARSTASCSQLELIKAKQPAGSDDGSVELAPPPPGARALCGGAGCAGAHTPGGSSSDSEAEDLEAGSSSGGGSPPQACCARCARCGGSCADDCCGPSAACVNMGAGPAAEEIVPGTEAAEVVAVLQSDPHTKDLLRMGAVTGAAIALHNIPEGLATFVGALNDTKVGGSIAAAIAIHNIPEGICVAMPIYYATGSRWKAFMWGSLTGFAEPLGGFIGYLALNESDPLSFAIVFGLVAGMMIYVVLKELLPSAFKFDPKDSVTSTSILVGMAVMAASLILFTL